MIKTTRSRAKSLYSTKRHCEKRSAERSDEAISTREEPALHIARDNETNLSDLESRNLCNKV